MVGNKNPQIVSWADSKLLAVIARVGTAILVPLGIWIATTASTINSRLDRMETIINIQMPNMYPRGEALAQFNADKNRMDGLDNQIQNNTARISNLEQDRYQPIAHR